MRQQDAMHMLNSAFGPGDIANQVNAITQPTRSGVDWEVEDGVKLMEWIAEQLTDEYDTEEEDGKDEEGS